MSQVEITCQRCQHQFSTDEAPICESPKCGTSIPVDDQGEEDFTKTRTFDA